VLDVAFGEDGCWIKRRNLRRLLLNNFNALALEGNPGNREEKIENREERIEKKEERRKERGRQ
jgi:hypothetical protein